MASGKLPLTLLLMTVIVSAGSLVLHPVSATFPGANGKIVFHRDLASSDAPKADYEIFTVNSDGTGLTQLTFISNNFDPRWSADGTKIVFESTRSTIADTDRNREIWIMNADGSGQTQLTFTPSSVLNRYPAFSPDGSKIVFVSDWNIWVMNVDGLNQIQLTSTESDNSPVWSPDGLRIVFARDTIPGPTHIFVMNPDGTDQTDISDNSPGDFFPEWSPDGKMIAFASKRSSSRDAIWVMNADGSNPKQLSNPPDVLQDDFPAWSPDGAKIAFARGYASIWVMNADGLNPVDITVSQPNSDTDFGPNWGPLSARLPVGGVTLPTNTLAILTPYLALAVLVIAVSTIVAVKRRKD